MLQSVSARLLDKFLKELVPRLSKKLFDIAILGLVILYQWHHRQLSVNAFKENVAEAGFPWVWAVAGLAAIHLLTSARNLFVEMSGEAGNSGTTYLRLFSPPSTGDVVPFYGARICVITAFGIGLLALPCYLAWNASRPKMASENITPQNVPEKPTNTTRKTGHVIYSNPHPTPCSMRTGTYYPNPLALPGGPQLKRPLFELEGAYETAWFWKNDNYLMLFEFTITNRGEESIVKDWELCLVDDGKPVRFDVGLIPDEGVVLAATGEKLTKEASLPEIAIREPIPHAHIVSGWVAFSIPKPIATKIMAEKVVPDGSLQIEDYLAHKYSWDFVGKTSEPPKTKVYVPGEN